MGEKVPKSARSGSGANREPRQRTRLADVAAAANVSKSIASRILNGYENLVVQQETRQRVLDAASRLHYSPHAGARAVAGSQTGAVAFLVPPLNNPVYVRILRGAFAEALRHDLIVLLVEDLEQHEATTTLLRLIRSGRIDGLIMASATPRHPLVRELRDSCFPHVFVNRAVRDSQRNVVMDDAKSSEAAWRHLFGLGHRSIGLVGGPLQSESSRRRERAFLAAASRDGLEVPVERASFTEGGGAQATRALLSRHPELTALHTSSLSQAVGTLGAAAAAGVSVPEQLSVIAYDDMPLAEHLNPPLTTIRMPLGELGAAAVTALVAQLDGHGFRDQVVNTGPEVIARRSTASVPPS